MINRIKYILLLLFFPFFLFAQNYQFDFSFGDFRNASSFYMSPAGFLYVTDSGTDEIFKLDTLGRLLKHNGGFGWDKGAFDNPVDIFATPLNIYVCDLNNHRVQRFDKDLNFISQLYTRESDNNDAQFGYPSSCATSRQGDLFILDTENKRIIKFDLFGNFIMNFGGFDAGIYSLINPVKFSISESSYLYVLDDKRVVVFDQYGNGIAIFPVINSFNSINIIYNKLTVNTTGQLFFSDLNSQFSLSEITPKDISENVIKSSLIFNNKLYILTPERIEVYKKNNFQ